MTPHRCGSFPWERSLRTSCKCDAESRSWARAGNEGREGEPGAGAPLAGGLGAGLAGPSQHLFCPGAQGQVGVVQRMLCPSRVHRGWGLLVV